MDTIVVSCFIVCIVAEKGLHKTKWYLKTRNPWISDIGIKNNLMIKISKRHLKEIQ